MKTCSRCQSLLPLASFYKHKRAKDGYCAYCIECDKKAKRDYYQRNIEKTKENVRRWQEENLEFVRSYKRKWKQNNPDSCKQYKMKRRASESIEHFTGEEWRTLLDTTGNKCLACGSTERLSDDHVVPLALGGSNGIDNIQPLCVDCNCKKGIKETDYREF